MIASVFAVALAKLGRDWYVAANAPPKADMAKKPWEGEPPGWQG